ncbi:pirin family protein [Modestobacter sp. VKM Ac-2979]|uniref:pirin family protein n=1 Tax=unclassified Modestobacter TaxID=2643866 RepID=UPI0022AB89AD|nr:MULTISPECIES: pirin family protein [unclassified Modestobacter]MCZ2813507.1 pirin family protein [Modestobacter sp. VKM Ac-2979]MCZ2842301.1 pirin family protein [Modestobacter sp. VKM Ac-2980]
MSNLEPRPAPHELGGRAQASAGPALDLLPGKEVLLGEATHVRRLLPTLGRRLVGAWAFVDHYGPDDVFGSEGMQVLPHPHTGLQTVSWLLDGEVHHRDSLGSDVVIRPRELALMTAGHAIAHAEQSPAVHPRYLHGAQLWVALPEGVRDVAPAFEHHTALPGFDSDGVQATVLMGAMAGATSPGTAHTPLVGVDLALSAGADVELPLEPDFEYAVLTASGSADVEGVPLTPGAMLYLGSGRRTVRLRADDAAQLLLLGGEPFEERIVMWWNFVGRTGEEIAEYAEQWAEGDRFTDVPGFDGHRLGAPALPPLPLKPRGRVR